MKLSQITRRLILLKEFSRTVHGMMQLLGPGEAQAATPVADAGGDRSLVKNRPGGSSVLLDGLASFDPDGDPLTYQWYGPFATSSGATLAMIIPEGTHTVSLAVDDGNSRSPVDTSIVSIVPCFALTARAKSGKVQLVWTHQPGTERYDIFRAGESAPQNFQKIGETTSTNEFTTFASGTASLTNGVLGRLDPLLMRNGRCDIRLTVEDTGGTTVSTSRLYRLKGEAKVGNFSISYNDLVIPISGVSITVTRTYDSRVKEKEDFGVGWTLALSTANKSRNCSLSIVRKHGQ